MSKKKTERYPVERSGFYHLRTQRALAEFLRFDLKRIKRAISDPQACYWFKEEEISGKNRSIQCPIGFMRRLHERLKILFNRIDRPDFLHAPRHGSSYITNARAHADANVIATLDIRQFYPSTTSEHVFQYFMHKLGTVPDVAGLLTKICTVNDRLPFGSPLSPILCFQVHRRMFSAIEQLCRDQGLVMTLYVDDIAISGTAVPNHVIYEVKKLIHNVGLEYHKVRRNARSRKPIITGVQLTKYGTAPANKSHLRMKEKLESLKTETEPEQRLSMISSLVGLNQHMLEVYSPDVPVRKRFERQKSWLHNERRRLQKLIVKRRTITKPEIANEEDERTPAF